MFKSLLCVVAVLAVIGVWSTNNVYGQVMRESDVSTVAGTLNRATDPQDDFTFRSSGNQVLVVDLDAEVYIPMGAGHGTETGGCEGSSGTVVTAASGCEGEDTGCSDSGPGKFRLELFKDSSPEPICSAGKPARPGWDRDPRLACHLAERGNYLLRVKLVAEGEIESLTEMPRTHVFVLNISLRDLPKNAFANQEELSTALVRSVNRLAPDRQNQQ